MSSRWVPTRTVAVRPVGESVRQAGEHLVRVISDAVLAAPPRLGAVRVVALDGPSGSGKSTLAEVLRGEFERCGASVELVPTDHFATWDNPVSWWPRLVDGVLRPLRTGQSGHYQVMDWTGGRPSLGRSRRVEVPDVLLVEGVSAGRRSVRAALSALVWVEVASAGVRLARAVRRDGAGARPDLLRWQAFEQGWFAVDGTRDAADHHCVG